MYFEIDPRQGPIDLRAKNSGLDPALKDSPTHTGCDSNAPNAEHRPISLYRALSPMLRAMIIASARY